MPERYFNPEQFEPKEERESPPQKEEPKARPSSFGRKIRTATLGAMIAAGSLGSEAQAERAPHPEPIAAAEAAPEMQAQQKGKQGKKKKHSKAQAKHQPKPKISGGVSLNARKDHGLDKEEAIADKFNLPFLADTFDVKKMIQKGQLKKVPEQGKGFVIDSKLGTGKKGDRKYEYPSKELLKYAAPYTLNFITFFGDAFSTTFSGRRLDLTSLDRTADRQYQIQGVNPTAAKGDRSSHLRGGSTFDFTKHGLKSAELAWIRKQLTELERAGQIQATEERAAFHIEVVPNSQFAKGPHYTHGQKETTKIEKAPTQEKERPRGYPTRGLAGHHVGGLFTIFTGIDGRVPEYFNTDFNKQLEKAFDYKIQNYPNPGLAEFKKRMLADYKNNPIENRTLEDYQVNIDKVILEIKKDIDWKKLGEKKGLNAKQLALLQAVVEALNCKTLVAYSLSEFMPSRNGDFNVEVFDYMLRNGGAQYPYHMPATGDSLISFGPYQMTRIAMEDVRSNRGVLVVASTLKHLKFPKRVDDIRGDNHHRAAFLFAIDNLANLMNKLDDSDLKVFAQHWRTHQDELVEYIAGAHTASGSGLDIGARWVKNQMHAPIETFAFTKKGQAKDYVSQKRVKEYMIKTKNNLGALRRWKGFKHN